MLLLRSASLPLPNSSWVAAAAHELPVGVGEMVVPLLPRARSLAHLITPCLSSCSSTSFGASPSASSPSARRRLVPRAMSGADHSPSFRASPLASRGLPSPLDIKEVIEAPHSSSPSSSTTSELDESGVAAAEAVSVGVASDACTGGGDGGVRTCHGGRGRRGSGGGGGGAENDGSGGLNPSDSNHGNDATDAYYLQMIEADPGNSLILGNYAKFLKEVRGDVAKAQEYCERAILANPGDAGVLALYADLVWETSHDAPRAETYFRRAVEAAPGDCYILASYARVLWDAEEEATETEGVTESSNLSPSCGLSLS
ncbi:hypothetical protein C4D60_Mb04t37460 [Musa balbisiana]|uniref:Uncharacterized protein n=1 Tax=Musa balbisiana TaxID=52838 RepID=A0A4S8KHF9_MUSBA|nr:hypothetical protein C4D60_Mb04t37460 [Musa balbisiana]